MSNSLLQKLIFGDPYLVQTLRDEFPDLFTRDKRYEARTKACISRLKNDLARAKSAPLVNPPSKFETLSELIGVPRREDILLTPSFSLPLQKYLVLQCHTVSNGDRLPVLPAEFLGFRSALGKEYFIIECESPSIFYRNYALYRSLMVAANSCYFSNSFLPPAEVRGAGHRQSGALNLFLLPQRETQLEKLGGDLYREDKNAILGNPSISVEKLCNPELRSSSYGVLQDIDKEIDRLYDSSDFPMGLNIDWRQWALLKLYAQKTDLLDGLNLL